MFTIIRINTTPLLEQDELRVFSSYKTKNDRVNPSDTRHTAPANALATLRELPSSRSASAVPARLTTRQPVRLTCVALWNCFLNPATDMASS